MKYGVKAFTAIEALIALTICLFILPLFYHCIQLMNHTQYDQIEQMETVVGIQQLRLYLARGNIWIKEDNVLILEQKQEEYQLLVKNQSLTLTPGNLVFLTDINELKFYQIDEFVCMKIGKGANTYDVWIGFSQRNDESVFAFDDDVYRSSDPSTVYDSGEYRFFSITD